MVRVKNSLTVPVNLVKVNEYDLGTLQPGDEVEVAEDAETVLIDLREAS